MFASVQSSTLLGVEGRPVRVEVHVSNGLPGFTVVGQPDESCREARDRVRAALLSSGLGWPQQRITVNLAPAGVRKGGSAIDLAIAVALLVAIEVLEPKVIEDRGFVGELGLDGTLRRFVGVVPLVDALGALEAVVPADCVNEAQYVSPRPVRGAWRLDELVDALQGRQPWGQPPPVPSVSVAEPLADLADVRGQALAREALEVAAAGGHHLLMVGPPGAGKTMLARRLPGLLPPLGRDAALEVLRIRSAAGLPVPATGLPTTPPFRAPHHTASAVSLLGGGSAWLRPGELTCAHHGVLFLDELGEFPAYVLDALRQPLEEGVVRVSRARGTVAFPSRFLLVAASNPCPCGWASDSIADEASCVFVGTSPGSGGEQGRDRAEAAVVCRCSPAARARYGRRISGPLLDRFDLRVSVQRPQVEELVGGEAGEATGSVAARVEAARGRARLRGVPCNAALDADVLERAVPLTPAARSLAERHLRRGWLTARGFDRVRRVARTVADLRGHDVEGPIDDELVSLALELRRPISFENVA